MKWFDYQSKHALTLHPLYYYCLEPIRIIDCIINVPSVAIAFRTWTRAWGGLRTCRKGKKEKAQRKIDRNTFYPTSLFILHLHYSSRDIKMALSSRLPVIKLKLEHGACAIFYFFVSIRTLALFPCKGRRIYVTAVSQKFLIDDKSTISIIVY